MSSIWSRDDTDYVHKMSEAEEDKMSHAKTVTMAVSFVLRIF